MAYTSARFDLPLLQAGQAQKELAHNEAIAGLVAITQAVAQTLGDNAPPTAPLIGQCWIIGAAPTGDWTGQAGALAMWTDGGWRFSAAFDGMMVWIATANLFAHRIGGIWSLGAERAQSLMIDGLQVVGAQQAAIAAPAGGSLVDTEGRAAITAIILALRAHGLIAT